MWHKIVGMVVIGVLLGVQVNPQTVQAESRSIETRERVDAQADMILADGDAADTIPVIITLQANQHEFARSESAPIVDKQQRASTVRILQQDFVGRNATRMQVTPRQPTLNPIVLVSMQRQDIRALAADSAVISLQEDKPDLIADLRAFCI